ncbi:WD domain, G-beta repeat family protein [Candida parapsilosis]|uniref:Probable cytosolic iron-sulfur protein assembly protein 1 n=1 Tax=Candida parapsilosis TaxID=5480 RepID=A0A8X7T9F4_CANPA|nr:WD domain, G-beta repeat family protein [Candida parapsilosis]KAF6047827.1 WD domain, G-beta repeat family protein [Candida parapsilosis]KAF6050205.1 WD domain, G-beta repeat family protein [Candida parapsilosis]KAF6061325.1 WD domain, G-beta repeat family protein [Candida parapsilosis]KAI5905030.1 cytosolic iron-sulfur protein assembly protein 1 [Candida parapsilosis]
MLQLIQSIQAHSDKVWSVSAHPTLPLLATASTDKSTKVYKLSSVSSFPQIANLEDTHRRSVRSVSFKPPIGGVDYNSNILDLPALASGSFDSTISIWGIDEPDENYEVEEIMHNQAEILTSASNEWNLMAIIEGHENEIKAVDWNFSGRYLASCSRDKTVWIWETDPETLEEFECVSVLNDHSQDVKNVTWHPTSNLLASSSYDDTIRIYKQDFDDDDWSCVGILDSHEGTVWCSKFESPKSPNATKDRIRLVSVSDDLTVRIWYCQEDSSSSQSNGHGSALPSSIKHTSEMVWEQECILPTTHSLPIYSVAWSSITGKIVTAGCDGKIVVYKETTRGEWEIDSIQQSAHGVYEINCVIWAKIDNKEEAIISAGDDGFVNIWRTE